MTTPTTTPTSTSISTDSTVPAPNTAAQASLYQQLRGHLAALKLHTAAEHLPTILDRAAAEKLSLTAALERLLALEVDATQARQAAGLGGVDFEGEQAFQGGGQRQLLGGGAVEHGGKVLGGGVQLERGEVAAQLLVEAGLRGGARSRDGAVGAGRPCWSGGRRCGHRRVFLPWAAAA